MLSEVLPAYLVVTHVGCRYTSLPVGLFLEFGLDIDTLFTTQSICHRYVIPVVRYNTVLSVCAIGQTGRAVAATCIDACNI